MKFLNLFALTLLVAAFSCTAPNKNADNHIFYPKQFVATGDLATDVTQAVQQALDACNKLGGGTVVFTPGKYLTSTVVVHANTHIILEAGAVWLASRDTAAYKLTKGIHSTETNVPVLIMAKNVSNISITGQGKIDGQAEHTWADLEEVDMFIEKETALAKASGVEMKRAYAKPPKVSLIYLEECENVQLSDFHMDRSPNWGIHIQWCHNVNVDGVRITSSLDKGVNSDGLDIDGSKNVTISNCIIETGDDAICLKSSNKNGRYESCENVVITNCVTASTSCALKLGTESHGDFKHIIFQNCTVTRTNRALGIFVRDGANVSDVVFSDVTFDCARRHFNWWGDGELIRLVVLKRKPDSRVGSIRNVVVDNCMGKAEGTSLVYAIDTGLIDNVTFRNLSVRMHPESTPDHRTTHALAFENVSNLKLENIDVKWVGTQSTWLSAFSYKNIVGLRTSNLWANTVNSQPMEVKQ